MSGMKDIKNSSYIAWFSLAAAEYLDLELTRQQLVCLYQECLEVGRFQNDFELSSYSCIQLMPLIYDISASPSTLEFYQISYNLAKVYGDANLEMIMSLLMAEKYMKLNFFHDSILFGKMSLNIAKKIGDKSAEKRAYLILLKMNYALQRHDEVIMYSKLFLSQVDPTEDDYRSLETCVYYHLGKAYYLLNQYDEAIFYSKKCLEVPQEAVGTKHLVIDVCLQLALIYQSLNRHQDAIIFGKKTVEMSTKCNVKIEMEANLLLCISYFESKQFDNSLLCTQKVINAARVACNHEAERAASCSRARAYNSLGQYDDAIIWGKKCVDLALNDIFGRNSSGPKKVYGEKLEVELIGSYLIMAEAHMNLEEYEDCILHSKKAITIAKTLDTEQKAEERGYFHLGDAYKALHRYDECILYWKKCIQIGELTNSKHNMMYVHKLLGQLYLDCLKYHDNAMLHFKKSLEYAKETGNVYCEMLADLEIARIYYWFEDVDNAILYNKKTLAAATEIGDQKVEADAYLELGKCYELTKQYDDAISFSNKSIDIAKQIGNKVVEINAYLVIARIHNQLSKHDDAIAFNERCNVVAKEIGEQTSEMIGHCQMGQTYFDTNSYEEAIFHTNQCIAMANRIGNKYWEMKACYLLGQTYEKMQQYEEVIRCTERCIGIVLQTEEKNDKMKAYSLLGRAYNALKQYDNSIKNFYKCIDIAKHLGKTVTEMQTYDWLGNTLFSSGRTNDALACVEKCLHIALEVGDKETEMNAYMTLGSVYFNLEMRKDAIIYFSKSLDMAKEMNDKKIEMTAYANLANTYLRMKKHEDAICYGNKALSIAQEIGERENEMHAYVTLGKVYFSKNMYEDAIQYSEKCLSTASTEQGTTICKGFDDTSNDGDIRLVMETAIKQITMEAYLVQVRSYYSLEKRDEALICIQKCHKIKSQSNDKHGEMNASWHLCEMYNSIEQFEDAIYYGKQCAELAIENGNKLFERDAYFLLRNLYLNSKQYQNYLVLCKKCVQIVKENGSKRNEIYALYSLADAFSLLKHNDDAIATWKRCIEMAEVAGDELSECKMEANYSLAKSYTSLAKFKDTIAYCKICIDIAKEISEPLVELNAHYLSASASIYLSQYGEAYSHISEGLKVAHNVNNDIFLIKKFNTLLLLFYETVGMTEEIVRVTKLDHDDIEIEDDKNHNLRKYLVCVNRSLYYRSQKNYKEAIAYLEDAISATLPDGNVDLNFFANTIVLKKVIAELYILQGQYDTGLQHYQEGLELALKFDSKHLQALFRFGLAEVYYMLKETEKAEVLLRESIKCFEFMFSSIGNHDKFKIAIVDKYKHVQELLLKVLIETNKNEEALVLADHFRALALKDILISNYGMKEETTIGGLQYSDVKTLVSRNNYAILLFSVSLGEIYTFLIEGGNEYKFSFRCFKYSDECFDKIIEKSYCEMKVRQVINCEDRSLDFLLDGEVEGISAVTIRGPKEPSENSEDNSMTNASEIFYHRDLPKLIIQTTRKEIVILPDGFLHKVPFAALQDPDTGKYLAETKRIRLAPSIATLKLLSENAGDYHSNGGALIIGNPLVGKVMFDGQETEFSPLENAYAEVIAVGNVFKETPLTGEKATKQAVIQILRQGVAVVHIAAHGSLTKGTIALAPSPEIRATKIPDEEDYMLTMADVQQTQVRAQLVVLSCCHSGRGEIRAEGVVGMCRAFLASGARAVVAALWAIDDEATCDFMFKFYTRLMDGKSASASLQQAMAEMRNDPDYSKPKYWAPFFLMGDDVTFKL